MITKTIDTIVREHVKYIQELSDFTSEETYNLFESLRCNGYLNASVERQAVSSEENFTDVVHYIEDEQGDSLYIHIYEIQWFNSDTMEDLVQEITDILDKCNTKCTWLDHKFKVSPLEKEFLNLKQGDTISPELYKYICTKYTIEQDEYEKEVLNVRDEEDQENYEVMQITAIFNDTYMVHYME